MGKLVHNVSDKRRKWIGSWEVDAEGLPPDCDALGRDVVYQHASGTREAGTISSFRDGLVFVRFSTGDTAAGCHPDSLTIGAPIDGPGTELYGILQARGR